MRSIPLNASNNVPFLNLILAPAFTSRRRIYLSQRGTKIKEDEGSIQGYFNISQKCSRNERRVAHVTADLEGKIDVYSFQLQYFFHKWLILVYHC